MTAVLPYEKWDGTGNDFVVVDLARSPLEESDFTSHLIADLCHRDRGVGADGVVLLRRGAQGGPTDVVIWNSDGSRGDMCGNALRCVALVLDRQACGDFHQVTIGQRVVRTRADRPGWSTIAMGPASAQGSRPVRSSLPELDAVLGGRGYLLSFGNPHYVVPFSTIPDIWPELGAAAQAVADSLLGTGGINCGFLGTQPDQQGAYPLRVFERGVGVTQSCGSGACAASAVLENELGVPSPHHLRLLGGVLEIGRESESGFLLSGPARLEFEGQWSLE